MKKKKGKEKNTYMRRVEEERGVKKLGGADTRGDSEERRRRVKRWRQGGEQWRFRHRGRHMLRQSPMAKGWAATRILYRITREQKLHNHGR